MDFRMDFPFMDLCTLAFVHVATFHCDGMSVVAHSLPVEFLLLAVILPCLSVYRSRSVLQGGIMNIISYLCSNINH